MHAAVAELVDALDSKSSGDYTPWEFESPPRHRFGQVAELVDA